LGKLDIDRVPESVRNALADRLDRIGKEGYEDQARARDMVRAKLGDRAPEFMGLDLMPSYVGSRSSMFRPPARLDMKPGTEPMRQMRIKPVLTYSDVRAAMPSDEYGGGIEYAPPTRMSTLSNMLGKPVPPEYADVVEGKIEAYKLPQSVHAKYEDWVDTLSDEAVDYLTELDYD